MTLTSEQLQIVLDRAVDDYLNDKAMDIQKQDIIDAANAVSTWLEGRLPQLNGVFPPAFKNNATDDAKRSLLTAVSDVKFAPRGRQ